MIEEARAEVRFERDAVRAGLKRAAMPPGWLHNWRKPGGRTRSNAYWAALVNAGASEHYKSRIAICGDPDSAALTRRLARAAEGGAEDMALGWALAFYVINFLSLRGHPMEIRAARLSELSLRIVAIGIR